MQKLLPVKLNFQKMTHPSAHGVLGNGYRYRYTVHCTLYTVQYFKRGVFFKPKNKHLTETIKKINIHILTWALVKKEKA